MADAVAAVVVETEGEVGVAGLFAAGLERVGGAEGEGGVEKEEKEKEGGAGVGVGEHFGVSPGEEMELSCELPGLD